VRDVSRKAVEDLLDQVRVKVQLLELMGGPMLASVKGGVDRRKGI